MMTQSQANESTTQADDMVPAHPFERAGLGKAPFRFIGMERRVGPIRTEINGCVLECGAPGQPMGTCDYCGTSIADCYAIQSADGKRSVVGCDCIRKAERNYGSAKSRLVVDAQKEANRVRREASHARDDARIDAAKKLLSRQDVRALIAAIPCPTAWNKNNTKLDTFLWYFDHAGRAGKVWAAKEIEKLAAGLM